jgi:hypothetical protein
MPDFDDYRWLVSDAAVPWLARAANELAGSAATPAMLARLRRELSVARAHLIVEQIELRERARDKFSLAGQMFFSRKGLEQATDEQIAAVKAVRFPAGAPSADLCCGIGGDLIALTRRAPTCGIERDPFVAMLAEANLRANAGQAAVRSADASTFAVGDFAAWHIDPDRRPAGKRTTKIDLYEPSLESLDRLLAINLSAAIKLAPAADAPKRWRESAELCWLGSRRECRQQVAWFGSLARHPGRHSATVVDARGGEWMIVGSPEDPIPVAQKLGRYLYEPHAAVLAAKLTGALSKRAALSAISAGIAYLTDERLIDEPALAAFEIVDLLPLDQKQLKAYCREHRLGRLEVKKRGVVIDPERLRKQVVSQGEESATLFVTPIRGQVRTIVARRVSPPLSAGPAE